MNPGWYPDPQGPPGQTRYWDGQSWSGHLVMAAEPVPAKPARLYDPVEIIGWACLALGLLAPPVAIASMALGSVMVARRNPRKPVRGAIMAGAAAVVFAVRVGLFVACDGHAWC